MSFATELTRAAAQRGKLDPLYRELSDDWTLILQRLFPVWALIGPGLAEPGHIELRSRTVYLDSDELLGTARADPRRGARAPRDPAHLRRRDPRGPPRQAHQALGHRARPRARRVRRPGRAPARRRPRAARGAAHGGPRLPRVPRRQPRAGASCASRSSAAVLDCIVPRFAAQLALAALAGQPVTRDMAGRAMTYLHARTHYGVVDPAALAAAAADLARGARRPTTSTRSTTSTPGSSGSPTARTRRCRSGRGATATSSARPTRRRRRTPAATARRPARRPGDAGPTRRRGRRPARRRLAARTRSSARASTRARGQLEQLDEDVDLRRRSSRRAGAARRRDAATGAGTGAPTGRMPDRGVDRPPFPDEVQRGPPLRQAPAARPHARHCGGSTSARPAGASTAAPTRAAASSAPPGGPSSAHPWTITREITAPIEEPHVALVIDTSGSMARLRVRARPDRLDRHRRVPRRSAGGAPPRCSATPPRCSATAPSRCRTSRRSASAAAPRSPATRSRIGCRPPRDGPTAAARAPSTCSPTAAGTTPRPACRRSAGSPSTASRRSTSSIGAEPLSVEASRICVLTDPADGLDVIAAAHRRRPAAPPAAARGGVARPLDRDAPEHPERRPATTTEGDPMTHDALLPDPALFDVTTVAARARRRHARARRARAPRARPQRAPRHRPRGDRAARRACSCRTGQLVPCIGHRPDPDEPTVVLYAGQRRLLAARASHELAGTPGFDGLAPVAQPDRAAARPRARRGRDPPHPGPGEPARGALARDQQEQFRDCWQARAGLPDADRIAAVCADLGIGAGKAPQPAPPAHPPRRRSARASPSAPPATSSRSRWPTASPTCTTSPPSSPRPSPPRDHHQRAARPRAARPRRLRAPHRRRGRARLRRAHRRRRPARRRRADRARPRATSPPAATPQAAARARLRSPTSSTRELDALAARATQQRAQAARRRRAARPRRQRPLRLDVYDRGPDFAAGIWVIDPVFMLDAVRQQLADADGDARPRGDATSPAPASTTPTCATPPTRTASGAPPSAPATPRRPPATSASATTSAPALTDPTDDQLHALREIVCRLLAAPLPRRDRLRRRLDRPRTPAARRRHRPPRAAPRRRDRRRRARSARSTTPTRCAASPSSSRAGPPRSCSTPTASPAPRRSAPSAWRASCATRSPAASSRCAPPCGRSCARCSPRGSPSSTATRSSSTTGIETTVDLAAHRGDSDLDDLDLGDEDGDAA